MAAGWLCGRWSPVPVVCLWAGSACPGGRWAGGFWPGLRPPPGRLVYTPAQGVSEAGAVEKRRSTSSSSSHWRAGQSCAEEHVPLTIPLGCSPERRRGGSPPHAPTGVQARRLSVLAAAESEAAHEVAAKAAAERAVSGDVLPEEGSRGRVVGRRLQKARSRPAGRAVSTIPLRSHWRAGQSGFTALEATTGLRSEETDICR